MTTWVDKEESESRVFLSEELSSRISLDGLSKKNSDVLCEFLVGEKKFTCKMTEITVSKKKSAVSLKMSEEVFSEAISASLEDLGIVIYANDKCAFDSKSSSLDVCSKNIKISDDGEWILTIIFAKNRDLSDLN